MLSFPLYLPLSVFEWMLVGDLLEEAASFQWFLCFESIPNKYYLHYIWWLRCIHQATAAWEKQVCTSSCQHGVHLQVSYHVRFLTLAIVDTTHPSHTMKFDNFLHLYPNQIVHRKYSKNKLHYLAYLCHKIAIVTYIIFIYSHQQDVPLKKFFLLDISQMPHWITFWSWTRSSWK